MPPLSNTRLLAAATVGALLLPSTAVVSADPGGEESNRQLANNNNNNNNGNNNNRNRGRSWQDLIPKRRTIPPYDRYRYALVTEWDPFYDLPLSALSSWEKSKNGGGAGRVSTPRPTNFPTQFGVDVLDQMPPTRRPTVYVPPPTPAPTFGPTTLDERAELCGIDGHGFLSVVTLKDKWGDGWDGARL